MRWTALLPEIVLAAALLPSFGALLAGGPRAGRVARGALMLGSGAALVAALLSRDAADEFLFQVYRIDPLSQLIKTMLLTGALLAAVATRGEDRWAAMRVTSPFFHLVATLAAVLCASTVDVLALALGLWLAVAASLLVAASVGRWAVLEKVVRRALAGWLAALVVSLTGGIIASALAQTSRLEGFRLTGDAVMPGLMRAALVMWSAGGIWLLATAPLQLRRLEEDPSGSRAAPLLGVTVLGTLGGLLLLRALALSAPGMPAWVMVTLLALVILPAPLAAAQRFAFSYLGARRGPALAATAALIGVFGIIAWRWIEAGASEF